MRVIYLILFVFLMGCSTPFIKNFSTRIPSNQGTQSCIELLNSLEQDLTVLQKARMINNQEGAIKGAFAEIGAGQEVAGNFFAAKRASETIVRTFSAYGKEESDKVYGAGQRYVSSGRLKDMLEFEYRNLETHRANYAEGTKLFAFANSVTTNKNGTGHGWIGLRFQTQSDMEPIEIIIHANFGKSEVLQQHEDIGSLGVNLIHAAFARDSFNPRKVYSHLMDNIEKGNIDIDVVQFSGRNITEDGFDQAASSLKLLEDKKSSMLLFDSSGEPATGKDLFYKKHVLLRGHNVSGQNNALKESVQKMKALEGFDDNNEVQIKHISFNEFTKNGTISPSNYADRMKELTAGENSYLLVHDSLNLNQLTNYVTDSLNSSNNLFLEPSSLSKVLNVDEFIDQVKNSPTPLKFNMSKMDFDNLSGKSKQIAEQLKALGFLEML